MSILILNSQAPDLPSTAVGHVFLISQLRIGRYTKTLEISHSLSLLTQNTHCKKICIRHVQSSIFTNCDLFFKKIPNRLQHKTYISSNGPLLIATIKALLPLTFEIDLKCITLLENQVYYWSISKTENKILANFICRSPQRWDKNGSKSLFEQRGSSVNNICRVNDSHIQQTPELYTIHFVPSNHSLKIKKYARVHVQNYHTSNDLFLQVMKVRVFIMDKF